MNAADTAGPRGGGPTAETRPETTGPSVAPTRSDAERIALALGGKRSGDGWVARCPAHDDSTPSLAIADGRSGVVVRCHAGCPQDDVIAALRERNLWSTTTSPRTRRKTTRYRILDICGHAIAVHVREDDGAGGKRMSWRLPDGTSGLGGRPASSLPLYRSERLGGALPTTPVIVCEGERATYALASIGVLAVGTVTGAAGTPDDDVLRDLVGRDVVLWPDHDDVGEQHMRRIADRLAALGVTPRWLRWPGARDKGDDAADFVKRGGDVEELAALVRDARRCAGTDPSTGHDATGGDDRGFVCVDGATFLAEPDDPVGELIGGLIRPGQVTVVSSPCGSGKSVLVLLILAAILLGRRLFGQPLRQESVLLVDVDNPRDEVRRRLKRILSAEEIASDAMRALKFAGSNERPPTLLEQQPWATMPVEQFALVALESQNRLVPAKETDTDKYQRAVETLRDIAARGPAVIMNGNTTKSGENSRGSGVLRDGVDWHFEVRDCTDWKPSGKGSDWWIELPEAGVAAWQSSASRKRGRTSIRIAIVCTKSRAGVMPDPKVIELQMPEDGAWAAVDVTAEIEESHETARGAAKADAQQRYRHGRDTLARLIRERYLAGDPIAEAGDGGAIDFLKGEPHKMSRNAAAKLTASGGAGGDGEPQWRRVRFDPARVTNRNNPLVLVPGTEPWPKVPPSPESDPDPGNRSEDREVSRTEEPLAAEGDSGVDTSRSTGARVGSIDAQKPLGENGQNVLDTSRPPGPISPDPPRRFGLMSNAEAALVGEFVRIDEPTTMGDEVTI